MSKTKQENEKKSLLENYNPDSETSPKDPVNIQDPQAEQKGETSEESTTDNSQSQQTETSSKTSGANNGQVEHAEKQKLPTWEDMQAQLNKEEQKIKDAQDKKRQSEEKAYRRRALIAAIGDGISSIANLYYANKGASDMTPETTMSGKEQERWASIRKARDAEREAILKRVRENYWKGQEMSYKKAKDEREYELKERDQAIKEAKEERNKRSAELRDLLMLGKIDEQQYKTGKAQIDAQYADDIYEANIGLKKSQAYKNYHPTSGGGGKQGKYIAYDKEWNAHYFDTAKKAEWFAKQQRTWNYQKTETQKDYQRSSSQSSGGFPMAPNKSGNEKDEKEQITIPGF